MNPESLARLEARHDDERAQARRRLENAENFVSLYRGEMRKIQEDFYAHATHRGINDDPGFLSGMQRVTEQSDENIRLGIQVIDEYDRELQDLLRRHDEERENHTSTR